MDSIPSSHELFPLSATALFLTLHELLILTFTRPPHDCHGHSIVYSSDLTSLAVVPMQNSGLPVPVACHIQLVPIRLYITRHSCNICTD